MADEQENNFGRSLRSIQTTTDTLMSNSWMVEFRKFITNDKVMGFAIGVIVGNTFTDVVKTFVALLAGIANFFRIWIIGSHHLAWQVIPLANFVQSFLSMLLTAAAVFFFVKLLNTVWARDDTERFGYNASLIETRELKAEQQETNQLLRKLIQELEENKTEQK